MKYLIGLLILLLMSSCTRTDADYNYDGSNTKRKVYDYIIRHEDTYSNKYTTIFDISRGPNIYRFYDEVFQTLCYTNSNGGMQCFKLSKGEWELLREQEINEVKNAKARKYSEN